VLVLKAFFSSLSQIIIYGGIAQSVFIVMLLNTKGIRKGQANIFLSVLLLWLSFSAAHIVFAGAVVSHFSGHVYSVGDPTYSVIAPLLWFYTRALTGERLRWSLALALHFLPFLLVVISSLSFRSIPSGNFATFIENNHRLIRICYWVVVVVQFSWYQVLVRSRWKLYQKRIEQEVSNIEHVSISWVRFFMIVFLLINILFLVSLFVVIHFRDNSWLQNTTALLFSLSVFALGYKGILQKEVFQKDESSTSVPDTPVEVFMAGTPPVEKKPDTSRLDMLRVYMEDKKPYLNPELTLTDLAQSTGIPRGQLSALINEGSGDNFYDFINKYRVEQVKRFMAEPHMQHYSMLGLALEAGFKSKSTFNLIFKRFTGLTPTEYRKNLLL
jgi:AraC-like DNA-binding protein